MIPLSGEVVVLYRTSTVVICTVGIPKLHPISLRVPLLDRTSLDFFLTPDSAASLHLLHPKALTSRGPLPLFCTTYFSLICHSSNVLPQLLL